MPKHVCCCFFSKHSPLEALLQHVGLAADREFTFFIGKSSLVWLSSECNSFVTHSISLSPLSKKCTMRKQTLNILTGTFCPFLTNVLLSLLLLPMTLCHTHISNALLLFFIFLINKFLKPHLFCTRPYVKWYYPVQSSIRNSKITLAAISLRRLAYQPSPC